MTLPPEPFFFSAQGSELFGLYQSPLGPSRKEGIVLCNPLPQEMMRSNHALVQLSRQLAELGFAVLRFDYFGTGDSHGILQDASLELWQSNIKSAISALKKHSGVSSLQLCGLRLGARLALMVSEEIGMRQLVLWDPIGDGQAYVQRLEASHTAMLHRQPYEAPMPSPLYKGEQCWGFPWPKTLRDELTQLRLSDVTTACKQVCLLQSEAPSSSDDLAPQLSPQTKLKTEIIGQPLHWDDDRFIKIRAYPAAHLKRLCAAIEGGSHG